MPNQSMTILRASSAWLGSVAASRSQKTYETYRCAAKSFLSALFIQNVNAQKTQVSALTVHHIAGFIERLHKHSVSTEKLYLSGIRQFYKFLSAEEYLTVNMDKLDTLISQRSRRPGIRIPKFPESDIEQVLAWTENKMPIASQGRARLITMRDRALILLLADTGLRIHEACKIRRGDIDWKKKIITVIGKRNKESIVYLSKRSSHTLNLYLLERAKQNGESGVELIKQPVFARHDLATGKKLSKITTTTGRNVVMWVCMNALGNNDSMIHPHSFRHYFVTKATRANSLKVAQVLARHDNISTTAGYAHATDKEIQKGYKRTVRQ